LRDIIEIFRRMLRFVYEIKSPNQYGIFSFFKSYGRTRSTEKFDNKKQEIKLH